MRFAFFIRRNYSAGASSFFLRGFFGASPSAAAAGFFLGSFSADAAFFFDLASFSGAAWTSFGADFSASFFSLASFNACILAMFLSKAAIRISVSLIYDLRFFTRGSALTFSSATPCPASFCSRISSFLFNILRCSMRTSLLFDAILSSPEVSNNILLCVRN